MDFHINEIIKPNLSNNTIEINLQFNRKNKEVKKFIEYIKSYNASIIGQKDFLIKIIPYNEIIFFFSKEKFNYCQTSDNIYKVKNKLYEIEKMSLDFMRISKNCIVNIEHIKDFDMSKTGKININMDNDVSLAVSRRRIRNVLDFFDERINQV